MSKHTPGPWEVGKRVSPGQTFDHEINIFPPDTFESHGFQYGGPVCVVQANGEAHDAHLIAAAPELLAALKWAMRGIPKYAQRIKGQNEGYCDGWDAAHAAIAKTEGLDPESTNSSVPLRVRMRVGSREESCESSAVD